MRTSLCLLVGMAFGWPALGADVAGALRSGGLTLEAQAAPGGVALVLSDSADVRYVAGSPVYGVETADGRTLTLPAQIGEHRDDRLTITAEAGGVKVIHELAVRPGRDGFIERLQALNTSSTPIELRDYRFMLRRAGGAQGELRAVAVPFRRQADGKLHDWSLEEVAAGKGVNSDWRNDAAVAAPEVIDTARGRLRSEGWILTDGRTGLLIAKYNADDIEYAMLGPASDGAGGVLLGGSSFALHREPESMQRLMPGRVVTLGETHYLPVKGGWPAGYERFRVWLNDLGHGIPAGYAPALHWNELFDVGWYHSDPAALSQHYTRDALLREAAKAAEIGATGLYLDPGWEVCEGTTQWDEARLGTPGDLARTLRERHKLGLAFRTIGRVYRDEFPRDWYLQRTPAARPYERPSADRPAMPEAVPTSDERGARNLALLPAAAARASSCLAGYAIHRVEHLNDGWYNNPASWVSAGEPSWAEIDLGGVYRIDRVRFGSEHSPSYRDRAATHVRVLTGTERADSSADPRWKRVAEISGEPVSATRTIAFAPTEARWVRLEILSGTGGEARIDEVEIYEATPQAWQEKPRVRPLDTTEVKGNPIPFWEVCTQHPAWQREKIARIEKIASQGVGFMMFDEFDWRGPCYAKDHGHAVPSTPEGHVRAIYGLVRAVKDRVPGLLVEAHDPVWPWGVRYLPVYFDQTLDSARRPGSYDENWGFEFMWNPIDDLISGRALCLYYYNLGCDIPLYDHITMENDNDACLSFWWYASTVRHLGIGGKKGLSGKQENETRWQAWKAAMARYMRLREWFVQGRFVGLGELDHLHVLPGRPGGVLVSFNLEERAVERQVTIDAAVLSVGDLPRVEGVAAERVPGGVRLSFSIPPRSPRVVELGVDGG